VHVSNIISKFGVTSRGEAGAMAYRQHLLDDS
jgi:DNA-binding NarL/FixJ family response regulator